MPRVTKPAAKRRGGRGRREKAGGELSASFGRACLDRVRRSLSLQAGHQQLHAPVTPSRGISSKPIDSVMTARISLSCLGSGPGWDAILGVCMLCKRSLARGGLRVAS